MGSDSHALTVRLESELYRAATELARKRRQSLNALVHEALAEAIRVREDQELYEAFEKLGEEPSEVSVDYAFATQSEVVLRERA